MLFNVSSRIILILLFLLTGCMYSTRAEALEFWYELNTPHFTIFYPQHHEAFARETADIAERSYNKLSRILKVDIDFKIGIRILQTREEISCLEGTSKDYFTIQPWPQNSLYAEPDHWIERRIAHGLTHVLVRNTSELTGILRSILSVIAYNNQYAPLWFLEGIATYFETLDNPGQIAEHPRFKNIIYQLHESGKLPDLSDLNAGTATWPGMLSQNLVGTAFVSEIAYSYYPESLVNWIHAYAADMMPFAIQRATNLVLGSDWNVLFTDYTHRLTARLPQYKAGHTGMPTEPQTNAWKHDYPHPIPNSSDFSYVFDDGYRRKYIHRHTGKHDSEVVECHGFCEHRWSKDGQTLFFINFDENQNKYVLLANQGIHTRQLAENVQAFDVDGDDLWIARSINEYTIIERYNLITQTIEYQAQSFPFDYISHLDAQNQNIVAMVYHHETREAQPEFLQIESGLKFIPIVETTEITDYAHPFWLTDHEIGLIRISSNASHLCIYDITTHFLTCSKETIDDLLHFAPFNNNELLATQITPDGTRIVRLPKPHFSKIINSETQHSFHSPQIFTPRQYWFNPAPPAGILPYTPGLETTPLTPYADTQIPAEELTHIEPPSEEPEEDLYESVRYKVWKKLAPGRYWPNFSYSDDEGFRIGLGLSGQDLLKHHFYKINAAYLTTKEHVDMALHYNWTEFPWSLGTGTGISQKTVSWDVDSKLKYLDYLTYWAELSTDRTWHFRRFQLDLGFAYRAEYSRPLDSFVWNAHNQSEDPVWLPALGWTNAALMRIKISRQHHEERTFIENIGYALLAEFRIETPFLGAEDYTFINYFKLESAWMMPYLESHTFQLDLQGGYSKSDNKARQPFEIISGNGFTFNDPVTLHGYRKGLLFGRYYLYAHADYTAVLAEFHAGMKNFPLGFNRFALSVFVEGATAWTELFDKNSLKYTLGLSAHVEGLFGWQIPFRLSYSFANGLSPEGDRQHYLMLTW